MDVCVCIKRYPSLGSAIVLTADGMAIDTENLGFTLSPHEECAVEAAVQLIEEHGGTVTLVSIGPEGVEEQIREQFAIGADRAIWIHSESTDLDPQAAAKALADAIEADGTQFDLILLGSESADNANAQTGVRLAHRLGRPVVTAVKGMKIADGIATCERAVGTMREVYTVPLPAVVTVKDGLNIPRYPSVPGRIKARKKPIEEISANLDAPKMELISLTAPIRESKGAQDLGAGEQAADALVDVMKQIGVLS
jgi:electron transfer flavoprotein beta subunit